MKNLRRAIALTICLAIALPLAACGGGKSDPNIKEIRMSSTGMMGTLDPAGDSSGLFAGFAQYALDYLVRFNDKGEIIYCAAESYETNEDQTVWTFHLRENGKWSTGDPVKAEDFVNSILRTLRPDSGSIYTGELFVIKGARETQPAPGQEFDPSTLDNVGVKALDDFTLEYTLEKPCPYFLKLTTLYCFAPSKAGVATPENKRWYLDAKNYPCNGPYMITEFVQDERYVLEKNPYYYDAANVKIDRITQVVVADTMARQAAYETGELDVTSDLLENVLVQYAGKPDLYRWNAMISVFVQYNFDKAPAFKDVRVREAFALAIDRKELCTAVGSGMLPCYNFIAPTMVSNDPTSGKLWADEVPQVFSEDLARAKQLMAEAGYPNGEGFPVYTFSYRNTGQNPDFAVALQAQLKSKLGVEIKLAGVEIGIFFAARRAGDYELLANSWTADYADPANFLPLFVTGGGFAANGHYSDPVYDEMVAATGTETDPKVRNRLMHEAESYLVAEQFAILPVYTQQYIGLRSPKITGVQLTETGSSIFRNSDISQ